MTVIKDAFIEGGREKVPVLRLGDGECSSFQGLLHILTFLDPVLPSKLLYRLEWACGSTVESLLQSQVSQAGARGAVAGCICGSGLRLSASIGPRHDLQRLDNANLYELLITFANFAQFVVSHCFLSGVFTM